MGKQPITSVPLKSGLILEICKSPVEFFKSIKDDLFNVVDEILINEPPLKEQVLYAVLEYFDERFGV